jgi:hypothetical protein
MTLYYRTHTWNSQPQISEDQIEFWKHGYFQTEYKDQEGKWQDVTRRETLDGAEAAIDGSIDHYTKKLDFVKGPKVVKTFE